MLAAALFISEAPLVLRIVAVYRRDMCGSQYARSIVVKRRLLIIPGSLCFAGMEGFMTQLEIKPDAELDEPLGLERLLAEISTFFINLPADRIDSEIETAQRRVCEFLDLDRSSLFQAPAGDPETLILTHFHQPPGSRMPPEQMSLKDFFPWALQKVLGSETVTISNMTDLPAEAGRDLENFSLYGTKSVVVVPLSIGGGTPFGVLTFAVMREERGWPETVVKSFQLIAQVFANALARKSADEALRDSEERLSLAVDSADVGLWVLDCRTSLFWTSERARVMFRVFSGPSHRHGAFRSVGSS